MSFSDDSSFRGWRFETFEERLALSVQPVADFWYDTTAESIVEPSSALVAPLGGIEGHGWSDLAAARDQYGLGGSGQTVAIIDSGIAYDHVALGGGLGSSYQVVGGWDFAENDANPYDDAPAGFHGTHVAGIVGSQDGRYPGVAPNVDLVALRVFDDQGGGYFNWVEQALAWVHEHRNDYEFPITTINLSLGTEWNASTLPKWATLENELKQLADDGIFISVAAGNSFQTYNTAGLSYPAVSPHVTPVASVDASGNMSRFSQRDGRVLAAPGERVMSTLPDAFYGGDGIENDWGAASGSSMASPYVAGASVLVREAMQDLGYTGITQTSIADLFHRTADKVYDPATLASYDRINVARALETLVGSDDFGPNSPVTINGNAASIVGTAGNDSIKWQAGGQIWVNGVSYSLAGVTQITIDGGGGSDSLVLVGGSAAESATLRPGSAELTAADGSRVVASAVENIQFVGNRADRAMLYDSAGNDTLTAGPTSAILQGNGFNNEARGVSQWMVFATAGGYDRATLKDSAGADQLDAGATYAWLRGPGYSIRAEGFDYLTVNATHGSGDFAHFIGTESNDVLGVWRNNRNLYTGGVEIHTFGFQTVQFDGGGGWDYIDYYSSSKKGYLYGRSDYGSLIDQVFETQFNGVESVLARVRSSHRLKTDLAALEFAFQKWGRK
jgi:subtilisin family serine protease